MISVNTLFERVNLDLVKKGKGGYSSNVEFNRDLRFAQNDLMSMYIESYDATQEAVDGLSPFIKEVSTTDGFILYPNDYRHEMEVGRMLNGVSYPSLEIKTNNKAYIFSSVIRKPSIAKKSFWHEYLSDRIKFYPEDGAVAQIKYISQFPEAIRGVIQTGDEEVYFAGGTTDLIWPEKEESRFVNILLMYKGIQTRDPIINNYLKGGQQ